MTKHAINLRDYQLFDTEDITQGLIARIQIPFAMGWTELRVSARAAPMKNIRRMAAFLETSQLHTYFLIRAAISGWGPW